MTLTESDKKILISLARRTIAQWFEPDNPDRENTEEELTEGVLQCCGAFVSVYVDDKLRGCIGTFSEDDTLFEHVRQMALSAATADYRFTPIKGDELSRMQIEISVLSPRKRIYNENEIVPGIHGIYMIKGLNRGTLLPQVAIKQGWTVEEFLGNCAKYKAGIGWDGWRSAELYTYEAIVFRSEKSSHHC